MPLRLDPDPDPQHSIAYGGWSRYLRLYLSRNKFSHLELPLNKAKNIQKKQWIPIRIWVRIQRFKWIRIQGFYDGAAHSGGAGKGHLVNIHVGGQSGAYEFIPVIKDWRSNSIFNLCHWGLIRIRIHNIALHKEGGHDIYDFFFLEISSLI